MRRGTIAAPPAPMKKGGALPDAARSARRRACQRRGVVRDAGRAAAAVRVAAGVEPQSSP
jgi:hypothetical protein